MMAILKSLTAHNFFIFQRILLILVSKFMVHRALFDKTYVLLGLLSPLSKIIEHTTLNIFLPTNLNICFGCLKESSH